MATQQKQDLWTITPFEKWVEEEGIPVITQQYVYDVAEVKLAPWKRTGCYGAILDLESDPIPGARVNSGGLIAYLCDIPPGGTFKAEKHLYEEIFYVVKGMGGATIWNEGGKKQTFEWHEGSLFSPPLNAWHELHNGQGSETARLLAVTNAPGAITVYRSRDFIYNNPHVFKERYGGETDYFNPKGKKLETRFLETNFVPDVRSLELDAWSNRGPGANMMFLMSDGGLMAHVSEFPPGTYKKGHSHHTQSQHGSGFRGKAHILIIGGSGYDLQWPPDEPEKREKINFKEGTVFTAGRGYHQHFNTSKKSARYLAFRTGNPRYSGIMGTRYKDTGGDQIDYKDEDPAIRAMFIEELKKVGIPFAIPGEGYR